jgi:hypothetical protein
MKGAMPRARVFLVALGAHVGLRAVRGLRGLRGAGGSTGSRGGGSTDFVGWGFMHIAPPTPRHERNQHTRRGHTGLHSLARNSAR